MRILFSESVPDESARLAGALRRQGFAVSQVDDEASAVTWAPYADLVVLDLDAPDLNGHETCRRIRATCEVPIIGTSDRDSDLHRVLGLCTGLTGFLRKPVSDEELPRQLAAAMGRGGPRRGDITAGPLRISPQGREVRVDDRLIPLTRKEFDLLHLLAGEPGRVFTRREIMYLVWNDDWARSNRTIDTHVSSLRGKLGLPRVITTVRGVGFRIGCADQHPAPSVSA